jgi:UDPglucose 6-dehydrogenase
MRIAVIGTGYVGLVAGTCFADSGNEVVCVDIDEGKIQSLRSGQVPVYEPGLDQLIHKNARAGRLEFSTDLAAAVSRSEVVFIAVGTPEDETGGADLRYVLSAARQIGQAIRQYTVVVNKSTVPVGTADKVREAIAANTQVEFDVVSNPEFLKEGTALDDFLKPDRVVIGTTSERARQVMAELYAPFVRTENPVLFMDSRSAEITKYAANAMLATRISFMNDIAMLCERVGADVDFVRKGMGADKRIGYPFLFPGVGYGGSCVPKDVKALTATAREHGLELDLLRAVERTNDRQKRVLLQKALKHFGSLSGRTFGVWGVSFKPQTDDVREAPSLVLIEGLLGKGAKVQCYDPVATPVIQRSVGNHVRCAPSLYAAVEGAEAVFLLTEWNEFRQPDFDHMKAIMKTPVIFDGRNIYDPVRLREKGFVYYGIGRRAESRAPLALAV